MEFNNLGILLLAAVIIIVPFILVKRKKAKPDEHIGKLFKAYVDRLELNCEQKEVWATYAIGLDSSNNTLIYMNANNDTQYCIGLDEYKSIFIHEVKNSKSALGKTRQNTEFLYLKLIPKNFHSESLSLEFYNRSNDFPNGERAILNKWKKIIEMQLN